MVLPTVDRTVHSTLVQLPPPPPILCYIICSPVLYKHINWIKCMDWLELLRYCSLVLYFTEVKLHWENTTSFMSLRVKTLINHLK